jgi:hypothetical protein
MGLGDYHYGEWNVFLFLQFVVARDQTVGTDGVKIIM